MSFTISFVEFSRPPGVSRSITSASADLLSDSSIPVRM